MSFDSKNFDPEFEKAIIEMLDEGGPVLPITQMGEPVLRAQTVPYDGQLSRKTLDRLVEAMRETMYKAPGVGLAGPQIGLNLSIAVLEDHVRSSSGGWADEDERAEASAAAESAEASESESAEAADPREIGELPFHVILNPSYVPVGDKTVSFYEGCLSFKGYQAVRKRWLDIDATWTDEDGRIHTERLHGWPARIFQHETDHLSGEVYIDKAEIRSLTNDENLMEYWCYDPIPSEAAEVLGFEL